MIDWPKLATVIAADGHVGAVRAVPLSGGSINRAFRLESNAGCFFVKLNRADREPMFIAERYGLEAIQASGAIRVPRVFATGSESGYAYLAMEYIELSGRVAPVSLAQALASLHACQRPRYGFEIDNTIGSSPQINRYCDDWSQFWREQRLGYQLALARGNGLASDLIDAGERLVELLDLFFVDYRPLASLLHGDLWSGNYAADPAGTPVIYDPACYYGDHEADLAMMELFGNPGADFFAAYRERFTIDAGYAQRRELYNLYHLLNHANLFSGSYVAQSRRVIEQLLAQLR